MPNWKNHHEKRTPFLARGTGRVRELEQKVEQMMTDLTPASSFRFVTELPEDHAEHPDTVYFIFEEDDTPSPSDDE